MSLFRTTRFGKFLLVGGLNTLFGFVAYSLLALTNLPTWAVLIASNIAGMVFNFFTTGGLVFRDLGANRMPRFILCYVLVFLIYLGLLQSFSSILGGRISTMAIIVLPMAALTYFIQSRFVFDVQQKLKPEPREPREPN